MRLSVKKWLLIVSLLFIGTGCVKESKQELDLSKEEPAWQRLKEEPITFDWYINYSWYTTPWGQNIVSKAITDETGVSINFIVPSGNESQKLNAMIASNTLPDFISLGWWESQLQTLVDKDMVFPLNELADQYDPYFFKVVNNQVVAWYQKENGNLYCYPNSSYTPEDFEKQVIGSNQNFLVRKDIYEAIGSPDMTTKSGFIQAVKKAQEMFPEINGKPLIPIGADEFNTNGCNSFDKYLQNFLAIPFEANGKYYDRYLDDEYISWLKVFRQLNEDGYLSPEIFIDKRAQLEEKMGDGRYFCLFYQGSDIQGPQKKLFSNDPNSVYIAVDGPKNSKGDDPVLPSTGINGWTVTLIAKDCKDPERAIAFMSYLMSEQGQKRIYLGVEGVTYDVVDGQYVIKPEVAKILNNNRLEYDRIYGADDAYWMLQNNTMQDAMYKKVDPLVGSLKEWAVPYTQYTSQYDIIFESDSELNSVYSKIMQEWGNTLPKLLLAESEASFDQILATYKEKKYEMGYEAVSEACTQIMNDSKRRLGLE